MTDIHIIAPFQDGNGGDWRAIDLFLHLRNSYKTLLWSPLPPNSALQAQYPIHEIRPYKGLLPASGTLIIWGALTKIGQWYDSSPFQKVVLVHNLFAPDALYKALHRLILGGSRHVEVRFVSEMLKKTINLPGEVLYLAPHAERFQPAQKSIDAENFTVGRISRDIIEKQHFADPAFYRSLANAGMSVRIIGGTCLRPWLGTSKNIDLLPAVPQKLVPVELNKLDCFYYRTSTRAKEAFGLAVIEAMLCGLPVVCHRQGGYAELIEHGINGFLFTSDPEAEAIIMELRQNTQLRKKIGKEARRVSSMLTKNEDLYDLLWEHRGP